VPEPSVGLLSRRGRGVGPRPRPAPTRSPRGPHHRPGAPRPWSAPHGRGAARPTPLGPAPLGPAPTRLAVPHVSRETGLGRSLLPRIYVAYALHPWGGGGALRGGRGAGRKALPRTGQGPAGSGTRIRDR